MSEIVKVEQAGLVATPKKSPQRSGARRAWAAVQPDQRGIAAYLRLPIFLAERMASAEGGIAWRADYDSETDSILLTESDSRDPRGRYLGQFGTQATLGCPEALSEAAAREQLHGETVPVEWDPTLQGYRVWIRRADSSLSGRGISPTDRPMIPSKPKRGSMTFPALLEWGTLWEIATGQTLDYSKTGDEEEAPRPPVDAILSVCGSVEQFAEFVAARKVILSRRVSVAQADAQLVSKGLWPKT